MLRLKRIAQFPTFLGALIVSASSAHAADIGGTISSTLTITENSQLVDDVTCTVTGAPCIEIGAPNVTLELNGFTLTGQANSQTPCAGGPIAGEIGIRVSAQTGVTIHGPGLVRQFRASGINLVNTMGVRVLDAMMSTNCMSGILVNAGSGNELDNNVSVRNGTPGGGCGGIWLAGAGVSTRHRVRGNRLIGNGYQGTAFGGDFGIGVFTSDNIVEENIASGNTNGISLGSTVHGNVIRRNLAVGNPAVQVSVDHSPAIGVDINNMSMDGANSFGSNICLTSVNAPCPASAPPSITASPNPIPVSGNAILGMTTITWLAPSADAAEIHIDSPNGVLFDTGKRGTAQTGLWVHDGMVFYLQDVSGGKPLTAENTLATVVVRLERK